MEKKLGKYLIVEKAIDSLLNSLLPTKETTKGYTVCGWGEGVGGGGGGRGRGWGWFERVHF